MGLGLPGRRSPGQEQLAGLVAVKRPNYYPTPSSRDGCHYDGIRTESGRKTSAPTLWIGRQGCRHPAQRLRAHAVVRKSGFVVSASSSTGKKVVLLQSANGGFRWPGT